MHRKITYQTAKKKETSEIVSPLAQNTGTAIPKQQKATKRPLCSPFDYAVKNQ